MKQEDTNQNTMNIQWYPGHMTKTRRMITAELGNVDAVCEILDARIPMSSRNPDVDELTAGKPRLIVLNRVDQADPEMTKKWAAYFRSLGCAVIETDAKQGGGMKQFSSAVRTLLHDKIASYEAKGQIGRVLRVMVLGIPNVGKSTFINKVSGRKSAKAEDRPARPRNDRPDRNDRPARPPRTDRPQQTERPEKKDIPTIDLPLCEDENAQRIVAFVTGLLEHMDSVAQVKVYEVEKGRYKVILEGDKLGQLIGRRGETLDAIQQLTNYAVNTGSDKRIRIQMDAENYRAKREQSLESLAGKVAAKVAKYRRSVTLEPMNAYERHVIHAALQDVKGVTTYSIGTEPNRRVVVAYDREGK